MSHFRFPNYFPKFTPTLGFIEADEELGNKVILVPRHCLILLRFFVSIVNLQYIYRVSQEERAKLREGVPYVKLYRYNPKHLYPKFNGYGDNGQRKVWSS